MDELEELFQELIDKYKNAKLYEIRSIGLVCDRKIGRLDMEIEDLWN